METHYYNVDINWKEGRKGTMCSPELGRNRNHCMEVATPPEFPKGIQGIWSPEHLFTASVSSCLMTTFLAIAEYSKLEFLDFSCNAKGKLEQVDGKYLMTEIIMEPTVVIADEKERERANKVLEKSEKACLISNSINSRVILIPNIALQQLEVEA